MRTTIFQGLPIVIENEAGSTRSGKSPEGKPWSVVMPFAYGYIKGTTHIDGDEIDVFIGPEKYAKWVYNITQVKSNGTFDENKFFMGFKDAMDAKAAFYKSYTNGAAFYGDLSTMSLEDFKKKVKQSKKNPALIRASEGFSIGEPVTVDGFHGRGVIIGIKGRRLTIRFWNREYVSRDKMYVHKMTEGNYKSKYISSSIENEGIPEEGGRGSDKWIEKVGTQYCIRTNGVDSNLGCWPSREKAEAVMAGKSFIEPDLPKNLLAKKDKCPKCGSSKFGLMPTDFETAKCNKCGKTWNYGIKAGGPGSGRHKESPDQIGLRRALQRSNTGQEGGPTAGDYMQRHGLEAGGPGSGRHPEMYHGTSEANALNIVKTGFRPNSFFTKTISMAKKWGKQKVYQDSLDKYAHLPYSDRRTQLTRQLENKTNHAIIYMQPNTPVKYKETSWQRSSGLTPALSVKNATPTQYIDRIEIYSPRSKEGSKPLRVIRPGIHAGGVGSGRRSEGGFTTKEIRHIYLQKAKDLVKDAKQEKTRFGYYAKGTSYLRMADAHKKAASRPDNELIEKTKWIKAGGPGSGRKPSSGKGLNKWKSEKQERKAAAKNPNQMKLPLKAGGPGSGRHKYAVGDRVKRNPAIHPKWKSMPLPGVVKEQVIGRNNQNKPVLGYHVLSDEDAALMKKPGLDIWERPSGRGTFYTEKELVPEKGIKAFGPPGIKFHIASPFKTPTQTGTKPAPSSMNHVGSVGHKKPNQPMSNGKGSGHRLPNPQFMNAGGPGSGRHPDYGKFEKAHENKLSTFAATTYKPQGDRERLDGTAVHVTEMGGKGKALVEQSGPAYHGYKGLYNLKSERKIVKRGDIDKVRTFLQDTYGIHHEFLHDTKKIEANDWGEPNAGAYQHAHMDTNLWFKPPSSRDKTPVPTDDPMETNDKFLDVTKRNSKDTKDMRNKLLKRSTPGGTPPLVPVRTTLISPTLNAYLPMMASSLRSSRVRRRNGGGNFRGFGAASI